MKKCVNKDFYNLIPISIREILDRLVKENISVYVVGGALRRYFQGLDIDDYDVSVDTSIDNILHLFSDYTYTFTKALQSIEIHLDKGISLQITSLRREGDYLRGRKPATVRQGSLEEDVRRRDFTACSIYYLVNTREIIDFYDGIDHIKNKKLVFIGGREHFLEDNLRLLRSLRFSAVEGFNIEDKEVVLDNIMNIQLLSDFRLRQELFKIFSGKHLNKIFFSLNYIIAVLNNLRDHSSSFFSSTFETVSPLREEDVEIIEDFSSIYVTFAYVEYRTGANLSFLFSKRENEKVKVFRQLFGEEFSSCRHKVKDLLRKYPYDLIKVMAVEKGSIYRKFNQELHKVDENFIKVAEELLNSKIAFSRRELNLSGEDLIKAGFRGKEIGEILDRALQLVIEEKIENKRELLIDFFTK